MKPIVLLTMAVALAAPGAQAAMYKWVDANGNVQYTDTPPPQNAKKVEQRRFQGNVIETNEASFASRDAVKRYPVTLWNTACGEACSNARALLVKRGVPFTERNPERAEEQEAFRKVTGGSLKVPMLEIANLRKVEGYLEESWATALDEAGYPQSAPAGYKPPPPPAAVAKPAPKPPAPADAPAPAAAR